jgi:hypothetical protein
VTSYFVSEILLHDPSGRESRNPSHVKKKVVWHLGFVVVGILNSAAM